MTLNRRKFIGAIGAAVAVSLIPSLTQSRYIGWDLAKPGSDSIALTMREYAWLHRIRVHLAQGFNVIFATGTQKKAAFVYNKLDRHKNLYCTSIGAPLSGRGADYIVVDDYLDTQHSESSTMGKFYKDWYDSSLRTRLMPGAKPIEHIET